MIAFSSLERIPYRKLILQTLSSAIGNRPIEPTLRSFSNTDIVEEEK